MKSYNNIVINQTAEKQLMPVIISFDADSFPFLLGFFCYGGQNNKTLHYNPILHSYGLREIGYITAKHPF